ncbi:MAG: TolC family protein, partial [bacterium]|nr:TolC family protein [bacterium]
NLWAASPAVQDLPLPEKIFPQLDGILKKAVQQSPRMLNRALDLEIAENNRIQARANLLPSLGGYANYFEARDTRADQSGRLNVTKISYNFSLNQPLFYWGERRNNARAGEIQADIVKGQYRDGYRALAQTLRSDYLRLIVLKLASKRGVYYVQFTKNQLAQEEERLTKKVISEYQISAVRLAAEQAQLISDRAQFDFEMARQSFARLSGTPMLGDDEIPDDVPVLTYGPAPFDRLLADFLGQKDPPTIEAYTFRQQWESEKLNYSNQKKRLLPKFNFVLGVSQDDQSYTINVAQRYRVNSRFTGVTANWTIFDGFTSQAAVRNSLARLRQMDNDYRDLTARLAQQAQTAVRQLNFSARGMSIADRSVVACQGSLKTRQDDFTRGVTSESDVNAARLALYDARINASNNRNEYLGRMVEFLGIVFEDPVVANVSDK